MDKSEQNVPHYPLDKDLSNGWHYPPLKQPEPDTEWYLEARKLWSRGCSSIEHQIIWGLSPKKYVVNSKENYLTSQLIRLTHFMNIILLDPVSALNSDVSFLILLFFLF